MPCNKPLRLWYDVAEYRTTHKYRSTKITGMDYNIKSPGEDFIEIPCGQCIGCRLDYSRKWADRLMLELQLHEEEKCFFVTLTYDDDHIDSYDTCLRGIPDLGTGEFTERYSWSLNIKNLQDFMKRLRKRLEPDKVRFFAAGEYGDESGRPHYHLILFNADLQRFEFDYIGNSKLGHHYASSKLIQEIWPYGFNVCAPVTWQDCAYVARYVLKKAKGNDSIVYDQLNLKPPFTVMSRRPGIAHDYFTGTDPDHEGKICMSKQYLEFGENAHPDAVSKKIYLPSTSKKNSNIEISPPEYFRTILEYKDPEAVFELKKKNRELAKNREKIIMSQTTLDKETYLDNLYKNAEKATKILEHYRNL